MRKFIIAAAITALAFLIAVPVIYRYRTRTRPEIDIDKVVSAFNRNPEEKNLTIQYPLTDTLFPAAFPSPVVTWQDSAPYVNAWIIYVTFASGGRNIQAAVGKPRWLPSPEDWIAIQKRGAGAAATITVIGINRQNLNLILSAGRTTICMSADPLTDSVFFREVNLPFIEAVRDPSLIRWRFGAVNSASPPPIILTNLPVCGNCHSFTKDGRTLGMDVDYANDKGSYLITDLKKEMTLSRADIITWSDYEREDGRLTFGLMSQISPDGRYVISTVKDRSVFVPRPGLHYSQLFFPVMGILCVYDRQTGNYQSLPGADDPAYVQSNPTWSPDGKYIVFARAKAHKLKNIGEKVLLTPEQCKEFLKDGKTFLFNLYRVPFNGGKGGEAVPLGDAAANGVSNFFPRYSPNGKWLVYCRARSFMLLQPDSKLYIMPAEGGPSRLMRCNTPQMNSWHSWSSDSRWLIFSSKVNGPYTRMCLTHINAQGLDTPAIILDRLSAPDRAVNIPEFVNAPPQTIGNIREQFLDDHNFVRAASEFRKGYDLRGEMRALHKALELNPGNADAHNSLGLCMEKQGNFSKAFSYYSEAIRLRPEFVEAYNNLGILLKKQGRYRDAIMNYNRGLAINPRETMLHYNLGIAFALQKRFDEAIRAYEAALKIDPDQANVHSNLGLVFLELSRFEDAIRHFDRAIELEPDHTNAVKARENALEARKKVKGE